MDKEKGNEVSGIIDIILVFGIGALVFVIINGITLLLTKNPNVYVPVFIISAIAAFIIWPMDRALEGDFKKIGK